MQSFAEMVGGGDRIGLAEKPVCKKKHIDLQHCKNEWEHTHILAYCMIDHIPRNKNKPIFFKFS